VKNTKEDKGPAEKRVGKTQYLHLFGLKEGNEGSCPNAAKDKSHTSEPTSHESDGLSPQGISEVPEEVEVDWQKNQDPPDEVGDEHRST
jgi:hypothetical protein